MKEVNIINFDDQLKKIQEYSEITVRDKVFNIYKFPTASTILYNEFVALSEKVVNDYKKGMELIILIEKEKEDKKKKRLTEKLKKLTDRATTDESIKDKLYDCLKYFIEANGYKFNLKWWQKSYNTVELTQFIHICSNKDNIDNISKKKAVSA